MSRVVRSIVLRNVERTELAVQSLKAELADRSASIDEWRELLRAYRAQAQAVSSAATFYRAGSAARKFAEMSARLLEQEIELLQANFDRAYAGAGA
ncbi:hypothetical protein [Lentzea sp. NPDC059081]|uniref:hypothetical protein n=1 Tax=Lentzea sp. NPDC059081 TaxID=3346719 RepID=UPI0036AFA338